MNKKAQVQIFETIGVIIILFILVFIGFIFYGRTVKDDINAQRIENFQLKSIAVAQKVMFFPELQCSDDSIVKESCIDVLKLDAAKKVMQDNEIYYYDMLEFGEINVERIYPASYRWPPIYSRKPPKFSGNYTTNVPVLLFDPIAKSYDFGIINIQTISK